MIFICFTGGKYLIAGGYDSGDPDHYYSTEVVELIKTNSTPSFGNLPLYRKQAVGAILGNAPILCGGYDAPHDYSSLDSCVSFQNAKWTQSHSMTERRVGSAGVKINSTTFWILGGYTYYDYTSHELDSTEFIIQGQSNGVTGPKLPYNWTNMCAVKRSENEIFVTGGYFSKEVWIYDPQNGFERKQGPSLTIERESHSCSTMRNGEETLIVVAGGRVGFALKDVDIYDPTRNKWRRGKSNSQPLKLILI